MNRPGYWTSIERREALRVPNGRPVAAPHATGISEHCCGESGNFGRRNPGVGFADWNVVPATQILRSRGAAAHDPVGHVRSG